MTRVTCFLSVYQCAIPRPREGNPSIRLVTSFISTDSLVRSEQGKTTLVTYVAAVVPKGCSYVTTFSALYNENRLSDRTGRGFHGNFLFLWFSNIQQTVANLISRSASRASASDKNIMNEQSSESSPTPMKEKKKFFRQFTSRVRDKKERRTNTSFARQWLEKRLVAQANIRSGSERQRRWWSESSSSVKSSQGKERLSAGLYHCWALWKKNIYLLLGNPITARTRNSIMTNWVSFTSSCWRWK